MRILLLFFLLHSSFQEVITSEGVMLIDDFTVDQYEEYYEQVPKKFFGWSTLTINEDEPVIYVSETLFSYANQSKETIDYSYYHNNKKTIKDSVALSGDIDTTTSAKIKIFNMKLQTSIDADVSQVETVDENEKITIDIEIKPWSKVSLFTRGEARLTNGVSVYYIFYVPVRAGGWEVINIDTEYFWLLEEWI